MHLFGITFPKKLLNLTGGSDLNTDGKRLWGMPTTTNMEGFLQRLMKADRNPLRRRFCARRFQVFIRYNTLGTRSCLPIGFRLA